MSLLPVKLPEFGKPVKAVIKNWDNWQLAAVEMICVNDPDCDWRFVNDNSELSYNWDVIYWEYIGEDDGEDNGKDYIQNNSSRM